MNRTEIPGGALAWREVMVLKILLTVAKWLAPEDWKKEIGNWCTHISVEGMYGKL